MVLKGEIWNGRKVLVARDKNGRVETWTTIKGKDKQRLKNLYKRNGTFKENYERIKRENWNLAEYSDFSDNPKVPKRAEKYQYVIIGYTDDGQKVAGVSMQYPLDYPQEKAREEALENYHNRLGVAMGKSYEDDDLLDYAMDNEASFIRSRREGVKYYL